MDWDTVVNQELAALNEAYLRARIATPEYRLRRRMLLRSALRRQGASIHTLRRPAGPPATVPTPLQAMPMRRATSARERRAPLRLPWIIGGVLLACIAAACLYIFPPL